MGNGKKGLTAHQITGGKSLGEIKAMHAQQLDFGRRMDQVIDYRKKELEATQQQLYTMVEDFRLNQHTELRREVEVSYDLAMRFCELEHKSRPWWERLLGMSDTSVERVKILASTFYGILTGDTKSAHSRVEAEAEARFAEERAKAEREAAEAAKAKEAALANVAKSDGSQNMTADQLKAVSESEAVRPGQRNPSDYGQTVADNVINVGELKAGETKEIFIGAVEERGNLDPVTPEYEEGVNMESGPGEEEESTPIDLDALQEVKEA